MDDNVPLNDESRGLAEVEAHKPVIERETPHYFKCKDVKANTMRTVKMTIRGTTVGENSRVSTLSRFCSRRRSAPTWLSACAFMSRL